MKYKYFIKRNKEIMIFNENDSLIDLVVGDKALDYLKNMYPLATQIFKEPIRQIPLENNNFKLEFRKSDYK